MANFPYGKRFMFESIKELTIYSRIICICAHNHGTLAGITYLIFFLENRRKQKTITNKLKK